MHPFYFDTHGKGAIDQDDPSSWRGTGGSLTHVEPFGVRHFQAPSGPRRHRGHGSRKIAGTAPDKGPQESNSSDCCGLSPSNNSSRNEAYLNWKAIAKCQEGQSVCCYDSIPAICAAALLVVVAPRSMIPDIPLSPHRLLTELAHSCRPRAPPRRKLQRRLPQRLHMVCAYLLVSLVPVCVVLPMSQRTRICKLRRGRHRSPLTQASNTKLV